MLLKFVIKRTPKIHRPLVKVIGRRYTNPIRESTQIEQLRTDVEALQISVIGDTITKTIT